MHSLLGYLLTCGYMLESISTPPSESFYCRCICVSTACTCYIKTGSLSVDNATRSNKRGLLSCCDDNLSNHWRVSPIHLASFCRQNQVSCILTSIFADQFVFEVALRWPYMAVLWLVGSLVVKVHIVGIYSIWHALLGVLLKQGSFSSQVCGFGWADVNVSRM